MRAVFLRLLHIGGPEENDFPQGLRHLWESSIQGRGKERLKILGLKKEWELDRYLRTSVSRSDIRVNMILPFRFNAMNREFGWRGQRVSLNRLSRSRS